MVRNSAIDGVRALAAIAVLCFHTRMVGFRAGFFGVDIFFVLSGFLITSILAREIDKTGHIAFGHFYLRRLLRLAPPLLVVVIAYVVLAPYLFTNESAWRWSDAAISMFYVSDYSLAFWHVPHILAFTWSLSVEEHYYLLWPLALLVVMRAPAKRRIFIMLVLFALATVWRSYVYYVSNDWMQTYFRFDSHLTGLLLGGLIALLPEKKFMHQARVIFLLGAVGIMICLLVLKSFQPIVMLGGFTAVEISAAFVIFALSRDQYMIGAKLLSVPPLPFLGLISYAIYLWHYPIAVLLRSHLSRIPLTFATLGLSIILATVSYFCIERPMAVWRRHL